MDPLTPNKLCSLCFHFSLETSKTNEMVDKIEKYLQIKIKYGWTGLCSNCHRALEDFHDFYERVHIAQKNFQKSLTENHKEIRLGLTETGTLKNSSFVLEENSRITVIEATDFGEINSSTSTENKIKCQRVKVRKKVQTEIENKMLTFYTTNCEKCEEKFKSFELLNRHYLTIHKTQGYITCCKRKIRANDKYYLKNHMLKHLQPDSCKCRICGKELSSLVTLKHHMNLHKPEEERPFHCDKCPKNFCSKNDLKNHEKYQHVPESERVDFICDVCGKIFQKVATLKYHYSSVHLQQRKFVCEICAKCFTAQHGLTIHKRAAHGPLNPIQCHECHKWLKTEDTFQKHLQLHKDNSYPCNQCEKVCKSSSSLRSHLIKHSDSRPHTCTYCGKSFKTKTHLKNHSSQHGDGSSYKCPYCPKLFICSSNYYSHRRRIHPNEKGKCIRITKNGHDEPSGSTRDNSVRSNIIIFPHIRVN